MRIALGQLESDSDIRTNLGAVDRFAADAARDGAALVAFPASATYEKKKVDATFAVVAGTVCRDSRAWPPPRHRAGCQRG